MEGLDSPERITALRNTIERKPSLRRFYENIYLRYSACLERCPFEGLAVEIGSGAGFAKSVIPELVTSDVLPYDGIDQVIDGTGLPFPDNSLRFICMTNVLHHIPNVELFFDEAQRCLRKGGRLFMVDQHVGVISKPILKYFHHEPFYQNSKEWKFTSTGPLSSANGALAWVVFVRDRKEFENMYPGFQMINYETKTPIFYWVTGGLKQWSLVPESMLEAVEKFDSFLLGVSSVFGSFVDIEVEKV